MEGVSLLHVLGAAVRRRRELAGFSQRELAKRAHISLRYVAELEAGRGNISVLRLADIATALSTSAACLLDEESRRPSGPSLSKTVALLGLRGAGKSTIGPRLARKLKVPFVELDAEIEDSAGLPIAEMFELHGQSGVRRLERETLERVLQEYPAMVLATSGGIVQDHETYQVLRDQSRTVWLSASPESHWNRVLAQGDVRPMANRQNARAELSAILTARAARYGEAEITIDTDVLGVAGSVREIVRRLGIGTA